MHQLLAFWLPGSLEIFIILVVFFVTFVLPVLVIIWLVRIFLRNRQENIRLRLEVGRLADEVEQIRKQPR